MNDELRELHANPCKNCYACDSSKDDKCYSGSYKQCSVCAVIQNTIDKCQAHTDKAVKEARLDELNNLPSNVAKLREYLPRRNAELKGAK